MKKSENQNRHYRTLSRNIFITVVIVSFMPLIFVSAILLIQFHSFYTEKMTAYLETFVKKHCQNIDNFLNERKSNVHHLAANYTIEQQKDENFLKQQLASLRNEYGNVFTDLGIVNEKGRQVSYAGPFELKHANYKDSEWFKKAINEEYYISDVFTGLRGFPHFIVTYRKLHKGKTWILRTTVDFQAFNQLVQNIRIGKTGIAFLLNKNGEFQTQSDVNIPDTGILYKNLFTREKKEKTSLIRSENIQDTIYVTGFLCNKEWILVYRQDKDDAFSDLNKTRFIAMIVFFVGGFGIIAMAAILSHRMVGRISNADSEKEMMNQQVIESGRLASLGEMAAGIAHEINNPVAIMVEEAGWIQDLLEEEEFKESENLNEFTRSLEQIRKQGLRCRDITHKLLSFARRSDSEHQIVNINEMIEETIELFSHQAKFSNVIIEKKLPENHLYSQASQTEIQQIMFNLVNNALDAMRKEGGRIIVSVSMKDNMVVLDVEDNGPGIEEQDMSRIFDPFYTTKPVGKGTGLGLSICYGILNKLGGTIAVRSAVNRGTVFSVLIPATDSHQ